MNYFQVFGDAYFENSDDNNNGDRNNVSKELKHYIMRPISTSSVYAHQASIFY